MYDKLQKLTNQAGPAGGYWQERILAELHFCAGMSSAQQHRFDRQLERAVDFLESYLSREGSITRSAALEAEEMLSKLSQPAKSYRIVCVSHAHIDMNWMWGFQETAAVTVDTFRTVLDLMREYPDFTYAQSQASTYQIIEEYAPEMLEEIRQRIHEGRWEVTATTWVEPDKNMPNGESLARHILYTKRYLSRLLDIAPESLQLDFEPDTFGHNWSVPEILNRGGVKYYYHCRGYEGHHLYRWRARSGAQVLVYREPKWYNADIVPDMFRDVPQFCSQYGVDIMLKVYGVGDHGGGPTRRDVERIRDMMTWPLQPTVTFGSYHGFFRELERFQDQLPVVSQELNFVFDGCYTSQSRIKQANRLSEDRLYAAEALSTAASFVGGADHTSRYASAWKNVLFNHFHDILPGSGVAETREYALGLFQKTLATVNTNASAAMRTLSEAIDTSALGLPEDTLTVSEGAGAGYGVSAGDGYRFPQAERGRGIRRLFHLFNPTQYDRKESVELLVWDRNQDPGRAVFTTPKGERIPSMFTEQGSGYWGHSYCKFSLLAEVPAFGYTTCILDQAELPEPALLPFLQPRVDCSPDSDLVMENQLVRAVFERSSMKLVELKDRRSGRILVDRSRPAGVFRLITEDTVQGMTAWRVGNYMDVQDLNGQEKVCVTKIETDPSCLRKRIAYELAFRRSRLWVTVTLEENSSMLDYQVKADWQEVGSPAEGIPQLNFLAPVAYSCSQYRYDIPFGTIDRKELASDVVANSFAAALSEEGDEKGVLQVVTDSKYGFRGTDSSLSVSLLRSSYDPDPYPEQGIHYFRLGLGAAENSCSQTLFAQASRFVHPIAFVSGTGHPGKLPPTGQLLKAEGDLRVCSIKKPEDGGAETLILRIYDAGGRGGRAAFTFPRQVVSAELVSVNETALQGTPPVVEGNTVYMELEPYAVATLKMQL